MHAHVEVLLYANAVHCFRKEAGLKEEFHIRAKERKEREGDEFTRHRALVVVAPDYGIQANLGEEEESRRRRRTRRRNGKLSWWLEREREEGD